MPVMNELVPVDDQMQNQSEKVLVIGDQRQDNDVQLQIIED